MKFPTGKKVFDWEIPKVWNVTSAYIQDLKTKKKYCDIKKNNLHLVGYSQKVKAVLSKIFYLKKFIHIQKIKIGYHIKPHTISKIGVFAVQEKRSRLLKIKNIMS